MVEKFLSAAADYLKFTFGAMLLATAGLFLYAYIFAAGAQRREEFDTVLHSLEISIISVFAVKLLTGFLSTGKSIAARVREDIGFHSLNQIDRLILSLASVFLSIDLLMMLVETLVARHRESLGDVKKRG